MSKQPARFLTLATQPAHPDLKKARSTMQANGFCLHRQLAEEECIELAGNGSKKETGELLEGLAVDWCLHASEPSPKKLLICDMDSTIIGQECLDELADLAGFGKKVKAITDRTMAGELDFEQSLIERVATLQGQDESLLQTCMNTRIRLNSDAKTLVQTMSALGARTALVSGGFTWFAKRVAEQAGFDVYHANTLQIIAGALTGKLVPPILDAAAKETYLNELCPQPKYACAMGDGANDIPMIRAAGLGIGYMAKPVLARESDGAIRHTSLATALYFQGIAKSRWVAPEN